MIGGRLVPAMMVAAIALIYPSEPTDAHPHVWVTARSAIVYDGNAIVAVRHSWTFDEAFSVFAVQGLDTDGDGTYSKAELQPLAEVNVTSLSEFAFFTFLYSGDNEVDFKPPENYWLDRSDDGILTLNFTLPLKTVLKDKTAKLEVFDPTYFVAFAFDKDRPIELVSAPKTCAAIVEHARELDASTSAVLAEIPASVRDLPSDLFQVTETLSNTVRVNC